MHTEAYQTKAVQLPVKMEKSEVSAKVKIDAQKELTMVEANRYADSSSKRKR